LKPASNQLSNISVKLEVLLDLGSYSNSFSYIDANNLGVEVGDIVAVRLKGRLLNGLVIAQNTYSKINKCENKITKNFYNKLGFDKEKNFIDFLKKKEINYESLKEKIVLEALWNQIIFNNFNKRVRIDESLLKKKIIDYYNSKDKKFEYQLSEIVIGNEKDINLKKKEIYNCNKKTETD